ncbi:MAG: 50S ribosomal protein L3 [Candidatus Aminicenantes bacterium]|nr:50S ribosomal protein L3 [Candidatus Aminicenantes bacterium]
MVEGLIGRKIGMSQTFDQQGNVIPLTVIKAGPCTVIQKKTEEKDGYSVLQIGLVEEKGVKQPIKPVQGHFKKAGVPPVKILREFRFAQEAKIKEGDQILVDIFHEGEKVHVTGTSKGKGFASVIKRWGFRGGKASHGSMFHRAPGSIGASAFPSRVVKGKKLPGHMGDNKTTIRNLTVVQADTESNLLVVKGSVPGARNGLVLVRKADFDIHAPVEKKPVPEEEKKPLEEEKLEEKRPEEKKFEDKKPIPEEKESAPEEGKPEEKKLEERKPEEEKPEGKKPAPEPEKQATEEKEMIPEETMPEKENRSPEIKEKAPEEKKE